MPAPSVFVGLELDTDAYAGVPCWSGGPTHWAHITVAVAYDLRYATDVRPHMCDGGIGKKALIVIAAAMARYADWSTGRNCRPTNHQLAAATGFCERTIQRAHECLRLLGVATEVLRGRQRTYTERLASWRMGDRHRGWASVWALHDNPHVNRVIHSLSPHLERSPVTTPPPCLKTLVTTHTGARARHHGAPRRRAPDEGGRRLAAKWRAGPDAPPWARMYTTGSWAGMLAAPAAAGWTPADLTALVRDWLGTGHWIPDAPARPIALLGTLLAWHTSHNSLADRPAALDEAREAHARAAEQARAAAAEQTRRERAAGRERGKAAATGPGRAAAFGALASARQRAAHRRTAAAAAEQAAREELLAHARRPNRGDDDFYRRDLWR
ncbi:helix-turn-helix domain-containing protein [Mycobacterium avium subsp. hominissuis]|uniref:helix-turn-helix domain-containing protein n=1 Tax=Mycobacterium avium TaxID=1764 RepID=UPI00293AC51A|nr:helix-turn-helix domain-containing protein [Mycobacterium avium subsp. hominissuis]MDV3276634.1 helix-turn-helix domain-containing protein [Mycobacterium avium subsp. hominissuis]MDV3324206.1 helix-turn-helix domain-containing protein [Mycobacterium avium subsp. hominissuis]